MHSPVLRIALLLFVALAASAAATWAKAHLDASTHSHPAHALSSTAARSRHS